MVFRVLATRIFSVIRFTKNVKFAFRINLSLCSVDVIMTSSKMPFSRAGVIQRSLRSMKNKTIVEKLAITDLVDWKHGNKLFFDFQTVTSTVTATATTTTTATVGGLVV